MEEKKDNVKGFKNPFKDMDEEKKKFVFGAILAGAVVISGLAYYFNSKMEAENKGKVDTSKPPVNVVERDVSKEKWTTEESKKVAELQERQKQLEDLLKKSEEEKKALQQNQNPNNLPPIVVSNPPASPQPQPQPQPVMQPPVEPQQPVSLPPPPPQNSVQNQGKSNSNQNLPPIDTVIQKPKKTYTVMTDLIEYNSGNSATNQGQTGQSNVNNVNQNNTSVDNQNKAVTTVENAGYSVPQNPQKSGSRKSIDTYIPPGTFSRVVLLSGVDAPSGSSASGNPVPVLLKIKDLSILPNKFKSDFRECFIIGSARGDLKSERAYIRAETLSCVKRDGSVLERNVTGYVAGEDGKAGLSGRVVTKAGQMIARSILAGFVEGVARAFSQQAMTISVSPLGQTSTINPNQTLKYGLGQGMASGAHKLVDYYLNLANNLIPVIEINAGREVDFVFLKGVDLSDNAKSN